MRVGCPPTPMVTWAASPHMSLAPGSEQRVTHCCYEHADQTSVHLRTLGQPAATADRKKRGGGFLLKDAEPEVLLTAIRTVHEGEAVISSRMTARLLEYIGQLPDRGPHAHQGAPLTAALTPREHEVLEAMARRQQSRDRRRPAAVRGDGEVPRGPDLRQDRVARPGPRCHPRIPGRPRCPGRARLSGVATLGGPDAREKDDDSEADEVGQTAQLPPEIVHVLGGLAGDAEHGIA